MINPSRDGLLKNVIEYVSASTGLVQSDIIRGNQNAPIPTGANYSTVLYVSSVSDGTVNIEKSANIDPQKIDYKIRGKRFYLFSIQFYRTGAVDLGKELMLYHETPAGEIFLQSALFSVRLVNEITQVSAVVSENFEERATIDFNVIVSETKNLVVNKVASIDVELSFDGNSDIQETFEIKGT